jgi:hypothetical protein
LLFFAKALRLRRIFIAAKPMAPEWATTRALDQRRANETARTTCWA